MWPTSKRQFSRTDKEKGTFKLKPGYFKGHYPKLAIVFKINLRNFPLSAVLRASPSDPGQLRDSRKSGQLRLPVLPPERAPSRSVRLSRLLSPRNPSSPHSLYAHLSLCPSTRLLPATQTPGPARRSGLGRRPRGHLFSRTALLPPDTSHLRHLPPETAPPAAAPKPLAPGAFLRSLLQDPPLTALLYFSHLLLPVHPSRPDTRRPWDPGLLQPPSLASRRPLPLTSLPSSSSSHSAFIPIRRKHQLRSPARPSVTREPGSPIVHSDQGRSQHKAGP